MPDIAAEKIARFFSIPSKESGDKAYFVAHNASFDKRFIRAHCKRYNTKVYLPYISIDTVQLAAMFLVPSGLENHKMDTIREFLGWSTENAHTATKDCEDVVKLFDFFCLNWTAAL